MFHFIINPASRSGKGQRLWDEIIEPALIQKKVSYQSYCSKSPGEVTDIIRMLSTKYNDAPLRLVILGGDGTINETLQGMERFDNTTISYIPTGSSNDLARDMGIKGGSLKILDAVLQTDNTVSMDVGLLSTQYGKRRFAVSCGIGYDAAVCHESLHSKIKVTLNRLGLGKLTYLGIALKQLLVTKPVSCDIYLDDEEPVHIKKILFIATMNHRYEGGGFKFSPDAVWNDGILDICVAGSLPKLVILLALPTAFWGKHYMFPGMVSYRAKKIRIKTSVPLWVHTDGEVCEQNDDICISLDSEKLLFRF